MKTQNQFQMSQSNTYGESLPVEFKTWNDFYNHLIDLEAFGGEEVSYDGRSFKTQTIFDKVDEENKYSTELPSPFTSWTSFYESLNMDERPTDDDVVYQRVVKIGGLSQTYPIAKSDQAIEQHTFKKQYILDKVSEEKTTTLNQNTPALISVTEGDYTIAVWSINGGFEAQAFKNNQPATAKYSMEIPTAINVKAYTGKSFTHLVDQIRADIMEGRVAS